MKKIRFACIAIACMAACSVVAQGYARLQLNFAPQVMEIKDFPEISSSEDDEELCWDGNKLKTPGFGIGFIKGIELSKNTPLFLEVGGNLTFFHKKEKLSESEDNSSFTYTDQYNFLNLAIPVNVAYRINVADAFSVQPFAGLNMKFNIMGKEKWETEEVDAKNSYSASGEENFFKEGEEDGSIFGQKANRFQLGLNIGCGFNIAKKLYVGYTFQPDLVKYAELKGDKTYNVKTRCNVITVGLNF